MRAVLLALAAIVTFASADQLVAEEFRPDGFFKAIDEESDLHHVKGVKHGRRQRSNRKHTGHKGGKAHHKAQHGTHGQADHDHKKHVEHHRKHHKKPADAVKAADAKK